MATKNSNMSTMNKSKETISKVSCRVHNELLDTSNLLIDETVATLTRMQKITGKVIKKSEPIIEKQIELTFDTVEALTQQASKGGKRALKLFGLTKQYNKLTNTINEKVNDIPTVEEIIDDAKEIVANAKSDVEEKIGEIKGNLNIGEGEKKVKATAKKVVAKTKKARSTAKAKTKAVVKASTKKTPAKTATATRAIKKSPAKTTNAPNVAATRTKSAEVISELTQIKGVGASLAAIMNDNGIKTLKDLENATPSALKVVAAKAGNRYKSFDTTKWVDAAKAINK